MRLDENGNVYSSFDVGSGFNGNGREAAIQEDGKIVIVGTFTTYNGNPSKGIVRLLASSILSVPEFDVN